MLANKHDSHYKTSMLFDKDILMIIYYNLLAIAVIAGIGILLDLLRCFRYGHKRRKSIVDSDKEGAKNIKFLAFIDLH